jgi:hypothetical protein
MALAILSQLRVAVELVMALAILSQPRVAVELLVAMAIFLMPSLVARWSRGWPLVCCAAKQIDRG